MTAPSPKWRHTFRVTWNTPWYNVGLSAQWRYVGKLSTSTPRRASRRLNDPAHVYAVDSHLPAESYPRSREASWRIKDGYTARIGVNNVFDQDPPLIGSHNLPAVIGSGNTFPQYYDALGRYMFINITADF